MALGQKVYFLHIPKTAGQSVHNGIERVLGKGAVSPIRVHTQVSTSDEQFPAGYSFYSGHLDWDCLGKDADGRFIFSTLRDPRERIGSFYLFLQDEARRLSEEDLQRGANLGKRNALRLSADDYFFGGDDGWAAFISDHYDNFYTSYFASRTMRGRSSLRGMSLESRVATAAGNIAAYNICIFSVLDLGALEAELSSFIGKTFMLRERRDNVGKSSADGSRWKQLVSLFECDASARKLDSFVAEDMELISRLQIPV